MWSALHLDDGTHVHARGHHESRAFRRLSIGYVQDAAGTVTELQTVTRREAFDANGLPVRRDTDAGSRRGSPPTSTCKGHAPVRLTATDGRVSEFARAWVSVNTTDGRTGVGWMEWNRNLRATDIGAAPHHAPSPIVVMGVSGSGKSTVGSALAQRLRVPFVDADTLHPPANSPR